MTIVTGLRYSLLTEPLIRYRCTDDGRTVYANLPQLFVALAQDAVRDYPALRPHQRHPWHAFLVQLAAIAMHQAKSATAFETADEWHDALLALTPDDPDGAAWCLVSPPERPALLQAAVVGASIAEWKSEAFAADEIDMLATSKNHDIKGGRARRAQPEDWLFSLLSLQTQEGFGGARNYGISRMNSGTGSRPGIGVMGGGHAGARWKRDVCALLAQREKIIAAHEFKTQAGLALVWLTPWDGASSLGFSALDPFYIDICRQIRLHVVGDRINAIGTGSSTARIAAKSLKGLTGDAWTPVNVEEGKSLTITSNGFDYKLVTELIFGGKYTSPVAQNLTHHSPDERLVLVAQGIARGQGKTEGYHERRVSISPKLRGLLMTTQKESLARLATQRIAIIGEVRKSLWVALAILFANGNAGESSDANKSKASKFSAPFESAEDARFFTDLSDEIEAPDATEQHTQWMLGLAGRAERILKIAFEAGPRNGAQKYRAQSAALSRFHGGLRSKKLSLSRWPNDVRKQTLTPQATSHAHA